MSLPVRYLDDGSESAKILRSDQIVEIRFRTRAQISR
jgi:hypothetical protein